MIKKQSNRSRGRKAQRIGKNTQDAFKDILDIWKRNGYLSYFETGPKVQWITKRNGKAMPKIIGEGPPDFLVLLGGQAFRVGSKALPGWIDTKHSNKAKFQENRVHQLQWMHECIRVGGWGGYLVEWNNEWRYHNAANLESEWYQKRNGGYNERVIIEKSEGLPVRLLPPNGDFTKYKNGCLFDMIIDLYYR